MSNFFSELTACEKTIIADKYYETDTGEIVLYEKETQELLLRLIAFVQSGKMVASSDATLFLCKNFRMSTKELQRAWELKYKSTKSANTFRCQRSVMGREYYKLFGDNFYTNFIRQDKKQLAQLTMKLEALELENIRADDLFFVELVDSCKGSGKFTSLGIEVKDCINEVMFLRKIFKTKFISESQKLDVEKLQYIMYVLNSALVDTKALEINSEKLKLLKAFGVLHESMGERLALPEGL